MKQVIQSQSHQLEQGEQVRVKGGQAAQDTAIEAVGLNEGKVLEPFDQVPGGEV